MNMKKAIASIGLCLAVLFTTIFCTNYASADKANINATPQNAWLSDIYIRESSTDFVKDPLYPDMSTFHKQESSFRTEVKNVKKLIDIDIATLDSVYIDIINKAFGILDGIIADADYSVMKEYLVTEWKVIYPDPPKETDSTYTAILYATLKYDLMYPVKQAHFTIAENTKLDRAMVILVSTLLDDTVDESVDTLEKYAILNIKRSLVKNGYLESVNDEVSDEELLLLYKMMIAENEGYVIENHKVSTLTEEEKFFVHSSYAAAVIKLNFGIKLSAQRTGEALKSEKPDALEILILTGLIESRGGKTEGSETVTELLQKASKLGCFKLEHEFYSDIYNYDVYLIYNCKEVWITPFTYAAELGKDKLKNIEVTINGEKAYHSKSSRVKIKKDTTKVTVKLKYKDESSQSKCEYVFRIHNGVRELPTVEAPTPKPPKYDDSYKGPNLLKPDLGPSRFELKDPNAVLIDPFKVGLDASHSIPLSSSILTNNEQSETSNESETLKDNVKKQEKGSNKKIAVISASIAVVLVLAVVLILVILKKRGIINLDKKNKPKKARRPRRK